MHIKKPMKWLAGLLVLILLTGCQKQPPAANLPEATEEIPHQVVYASFYPIYALSELILDGVPEMELRQLVQPQDGCLRNYQLSDWDLYQIVFNADALILGGRGLESFESAAQNLGEDGPAVVTLFQNLELDNNGAQSSDENASHLETENPHLYLSVRSLPMILESLHAYMLELDPYFEAHYTENLEKALTLADQLIAEYDEAAKQIDPTIPVALMNEALIYPADDLGLSVACRIDRESGTSMYSSELKSALQQLREAQVSVVLIEKQAPDALINALKTQGFTVVTLDTLSTGRAEMGADGYFEAMRGNLTAILSALIK